MSLTLKKRFPDLPLTEINKDEWIDYTHLHQLAVWCAENPDNTQSQDVLSEISELYKKGNLFVKNAIENEFLFVFSRKLSSTKLNEKIVSMPLPLRAAFIETLLQNQNL